MPFSLLENHEDPPNSSSNFQPAFGFDAIHGCLILESRLLDEPGGRETPVSAPPSLVSYRRATRIRDVSPRFRNDFLTLRQLPLHLSPNSSSFHGRGDGNARLIRANGTKFHGIESTIVPFLLPSSPRSAIRRIRNFSLVSLDISQRWITVEIEWRLYIYFSSILIAILASFVSTMKDRRGSW